MEYLVDDGCVILSFERKVVVVVFSTLQQQTKNVTFQVSHEIIKWHVWQRNTREDFVANIVFH